jgi:midasin
MEAFDVFGCPMPRREERERVVVHLANMWGLHKDLTIKRLMCSKPELKLTETTMQIGRVQLTRSLLNSEIKDFEMPAFTLRLMERLAVCVSQNDPVLLVGETGVGKTTIVQKLAEHVGSKLIVQNLNVQSEIGDLVGSIKPLRMRQLARGVYDEFLNLFPTRFKKDSNVRFLTAMAVAMQKGQWKRLCKGFVTFSEFALTGKRPSKGGTSTTPRKSPRKSPRKTKKAKRT